MTFALSAGFHAGSTAPEQAAIARARQGSTAADIRIEFHGLGLFTQDLKDSYGFVRDVPMDIIRDRIEYANGAAAREAEALRAASVAAAVKAPVQSAPVVTAHAVV